MITKLLLALAVAGVVGSAAQAQTTPAGTAPAGGRMAGTAAKAGASPSKSSQANSGNMAPNRSSTAGSYSTGTSNNPVDATGKPVSATQSGNTSTGKAPKTKK
ncbi:hypothetical protein [Hymenobacter sp. BT559]|uniref:hypothetical protein n=1 Tax=Hymenobacter sp. BT559 TaxID=2795729 RepID=UPI0018EB85A7|nr:hypothetical protein [Hymenobacter sp. BT559]MBJ6144378.1 hypothetical protein [Hymenobacter sp. BT559]